MRINIPEPVNYILKKLNQAGCEAFIVGGCVRDALIGREPNDWDITTSARPEQVKEIFRRTIDTGIKHGTVTVLLREGQFEVTTYRIDGLYEDGRHPNDVTFTSDLEEDLRRRDFTINAMAYNPDAVTDSHGVKSEGTENIPGLVDPYGGLADLAEGVIRAVGNPDERFEEDALRIMRAVRFSAQLGFAIEPETYLALKKFAPRLDLISRERIRDELMKLIMSPYPETFEHLYNTGITAVIMPEFDEMMKCRQNVLTHAGMTVGEHTLGVLQAIPATPVLRLAALLHDMGKPSVKVTETDPDTGKAVDRFKGHCAAGAAMAEKWLTQMRFDNATISQVITLIENHDHMHFPDETDIRRTMNRVGPLFDDLVILMRADNSTKTEPTRSERTQILDDIEKLHRVIAERGDCVDLKHLAIKGSDLIAMGIKPGPEMGRILSALLEEVLVDPSKNTAEYLTSKAQILGS